MEAHIIEWLNLVIRWIHVIVGIAWIGASFYFVWLENNLDKAVKNPELAGELWAIHGGGIYHLQKYKLAPKTMPQNLHWFKWEAYSTWMTGILLLVVVFYLNAETYLVNDQVNITPAATIAIGILSLVGGWLGYDLLCQSALRQQPILLGAVLFASLALLAFVLTQVMSGRAAYVHVGAVIGTMMVGNVFFAIMPAQHNLVGAIEAGEKPDPSKPKNALLRSRHNNYLTLPVLFIMISNHFPSTYGHGYNWAILIAIAIASIGVRHYFNTRHNSQAFVWALPFAALVMMVLAYVTMPRMSSDASAFVSDVRVQHIVNMHCVSCHAVVPTSEAFVTAPAGVMLDTIADIRINASRIYPQAVSSKIMPLGNLSGMTDAERQELGQWILQQQ